MSRHSSLFAIVPRALLALALLPGFLACEATRSSGAPESVALVDEALFREDFERGTWPSGTLTRVGTCASVRVGSAHGEGSAYGARLLGACSFDTTPMSTLGYRNVRVHLDYRTVKYDPGEGLTLRWSTDGEAWTVAGTVYGTDAWTPLTFLLPAAAESQSSLRLRFETNADGDSGVEQLWLDNVLVTGQVAKGCEHAPLCAAAETACGDLITSACGQFSCGSCTAGALCQEGQCVPDCSVATLCGAARCGVATASGCGEVSCGACAADESCVDGACFATCSPEAQCSAAGASCGAVSVDPCAQVSCGTCAAGKVCVNHACESGCQAKTCADLGAECGRPADGCGGKLDCGLCEDDLDLCSASYTCQENPCATDQTCGPLDPEDIAKLEDHLDCLEACGQGRAAEKETCIVGCGKPDPSWDKNRDGVVDEVDLDLAKLERADADAAGDPLVCYENGAVVPIEACNCAAQHPGDGHCLDLDGDGLKQWQEEAFGSGDDTPDLACGEAHPCDSFYEECLYEPQANRRVCAPRACGENCTAFHLAEVNQDNEEVIVTVHYDYSPVPATVLDLYLELDGTAMTLVDARPMPALTRAGKSLDLQQISRDRERLVVVGSASTAPIPRGPIAELVFLRVGQTTTSLAFSKTDFDQTWSIAPDQGSAARTELKKDALWGAELAVKASVKNRGLSLYYSFDDPARPRDYPLKPGDIPAVKSGDTLCELSPDDDCTPSALATEPAAKSVRAKRVAGLDALQRGVVQSSEPVQGVIGSGIWLDGISDHLELPLVLNDPATDQSHAVAEQDSTVSLWFAAERERLPLASPAPLRVLWSQVHPTSENRVLALATQATAAEAFDLVWLDTDANDDPRTTIVKASLPALAWTHVAFTLDLGDVPLTGPGTVKVAFFVDGVHQDLDPNSQLVDDHRLPLTAQRFCPGLGLNGVHVGEEGGDQNGASSPPEALFFGAAKNQLFGLERSDPTGLGRRTLQRTGDSSARDPSYSPLVDRLVYASNDSGEGYEIWLANGDGSEPRQVTFGFADATRGIVARRPRWAPDASGIVFESNVYDLPAGDNPQRLYHLWYLPYDATTNRLAIPGTSDTSTTTELLTYSDIVRSAETGRYRLTGTAGNGSGWTGTHHSRDAQWLSGAVASQHRGSLLFTLRESNLEGAEVRVLEIPMSLTNGTTPPAKNVTQYPRPADSPSDAELELLAVGKRAKWTGANGDIKSEANDIALFAERRAMFAPANDVALRVDSASSGGATHKLVLTYEPSLLSEEECPQAHSPSSCGPDLNRYPPGDTTPVCNLQDCMVRELRDLFVTIPTGYEVVLDKTGAVLDLNAAPLEGKRVRLKKVEPLEGGTRVRVDVSSDLSAELLEEGAELAGIAVRKAANSTPPAPEVLRRRAEHRLLLAANERRSTGTERPFVLFPLELPVGEVVDAAFSPDGLRLAVVAMEHARPTLLLFRLPALATAQDMTKGVKPTALRKLSEEPVEFSGVQWVRLSRRSPCQWIGARRDPEGKLYRDAFHGQLDELRVYGYLRPEGALASDAARGRDRLAKDKREKVASRLPTCQRDGDCPAYQLCDEVNHVCETVGCSATSPCATGSCTLLPSPTVTGGVESKSVCLLECSGDSDCYTKQCLNGPCTLCQAGVCRECTEEKLEVLKGSFSFQTVGCPSRNAFACEDGACVSECFAEDNGQSRYLCDRTFEFCRGGRCVLRDWNWADLSPATFSGAASMWVAGHHGKRTVAVSQLYVAKVTAYGVSDYLVPPLLLVEGKGDHLGGDPRNGEWFTLGELRIHHRTSSQASSAVPYVLTTPQAVTALRFKLINPPLETPNLASTGFAHRWTDAAGCGSKTLTALANSPYCAKTRPPGSIANLGYRVGPPGGALAPEGPAQTGLGVDDVPAVFGRGGEQKVVIQQVEFGSGSSQAQFGRTIVEGLNSPEYYYETCAEDATTRRVDFSAGLAPQRAPTEGGGWLLNCNKVLSDDQFSGLVLPLDSYPLVNLENAPVKAPPLLETANGCYYTDTSGNPGTVCYEWTGDARLDPVTFSERPVVVGTIEIQELTSFGYPLNNPY